MTDQDLTAPKAVEALIERLRVAYGGELSRDCAATLRALSAALEAEREKTSDGSFYQEKDIDALVARAEEAELELDAYREMKAKIDAQGGPNVIRLQMQARRDRVRAEAAESKLKEAVRALKRVGASEFCAAPASEEGIRVRKFVRAFLATLDQST